MKEISIEEAKRIGLSTLLFFHEFCEEHNLEYYLAYGSLIGTIRHKGFIPWDDDIDLWMKRSDYNRLLSMHEAFLNTDYSVIAPEVCPQFEFPFAKIIRNGTAITPSRFVNGYIYGCSIDIFPLDAISDEIDEKKVDKEYKLTRQKHLEIINKYHNYTGGYKLNGLKGLLKKAVCAASSMRYGPLAQRMLEYSNLYANNIIDEHTTFVATIDGATIYRKEWFDRKCLVSFEGYSFFAPEEYDSILRKRYGSYMEYPPESERIIPHRFKAYYV